MKADTIIFFMALLSLERASQCLINWLTPLANVQKPMGAILEIIIVFKRSYHVKDLASSTTVHVQRNLTFINIALMSKICS